MVVLYSNSSRCYLVGCNLRSQVHQPSHDVSTKTNRIEAISTPFLSLVLDSVCLLCLG